MIFDILVDVKTFLFRGLFLSEMTIMEVFFGFKYEMPMPNMLKKDLSFLIAQFRKFQNI